MAVRPTARALDSWNRMALPDRKPNKISLSPLVRRADRSSSPSRMVTALMPLVRGRLYASKEVFLMRPFLVARIT